MRRIRNISGALTEIKSQDPDSPISENFLRRLIKYGNIPCVRSGRWIFIDMDVLDDYLRNPQTNCEYTEM